MTDIDLDKLADEIRERCLDFSESVCLSNDQAAYIARAVFHKFGLAQSRVTDAAVDQALKIATDNVKTIQSMIKADAEKQAALGRLRQDADNAYSSYISMLEKPEGLGWEAKVKCGEFGENELKAHTSAAEKLGVHRGIFHAIKILSPYLEAVLLPQGREGK